MTTASSFSVVSDAGVVCVSSPLAESAEDVSVPPGGALESTESNSEFLPLEPSEAAVALLPVPHQPSSAVKNCTKEPAATAGRLVPGRNSFLVVVRTNIRFLFPFPLRLSLPFSPDVDRLALIDLMDLVSTVYLRLQPFAWATSTMMVP